MSNLRVAYFFTNTPTQ